MLSALLYPVIVLLMTFAVTGVVILYLMPKVKAFLQEKVLYEQPFVNPEKFEGTVGEMVDAMAGKMGENISVRRFARLGVGEEGV